MDKQRLLLRRQYILRLTKHLGDWELNLQDNDLLRTWKQSYVTVTNGVNVREYRKDSSQYVILSATWSFNGKRKKSYKGQGTGSSELHRF